MVKVLKFNVDSVYCTGDLHGNFNSIGYQIKKSDIHNSIIIVCGDVGLGFYKKWYYEQTFNKLKKVLSKYNDYIVFVRGNHDDKSYFDGNAVDCKRIKAVEDYTVVSAYPMYDTEFCTVPFNILCVGGAISIDRTDRIKLNNKLLFEYSYRHMTTLEEAKKNASKAYWEDEAPLYDEGKLNEIKSDGILLDAIATHTCPSFCQPTTKGGIQYWLQLDDKLEEDLSHERNVMDLIYNKIKEQGQPIKVWCYGHYHFHNIEFIDNIKFNLLDMERNGNMEMSEIWRF